MCALAVFAGMSFVQAHAASPFVGIQIQDLPPAISTSLGLENSEGVLVRDISYPGPGSESGIIRGDVILELSGKATVNVDQTVKLINGFSPGDKVKATVFRLGERLNLSIVIGSQPPAWDVIRNNFTKVPGLGITFSSLTEKVRQRFKLRWRTRGVVISLIDEKNAKNLQINVGDVVVQVNQHPVWQPSQIVSYLQKAKEENRDHVLLLIENPTGYGFVQLRVPQ